MAIVSKNAGKQGIFCHIRVKSVENLIFMIKSQMFREFNMTKWGESRRAGTII